MSSLSDREWKEFLLADIFEIKGGFYNKKPISEKNGTIPFIGATDSNNGITQFNTKGKIDETSKTGDKNNASIDKKIFQGNCIVVTNNGSVGYAYYQTHPFTCSHDVNPLYLKNRTLTPYTAFFLICIIEKQRVCFSYVHKWRPKRMKKSKILLPITEDGQPDYQFMEEYAKNMVEKKRKEYLDYCKKQLEILGGGYNLIPLAEKQWESFFVDNLFIVKRPKARSEKKYESGNIPFVASGNVNNGVIRCCKPYEDEDLDKGNCITVSPVDGSTFYQYSEFLGRGGAGSSVLLLYSDNINKYNGLFISRMIRQTCSKYCYGKMGSQDNIKREKILLPITDNGNPDYDYMEKYSKNLMIRKLKSYIAYANN